ncbi:GntR family transcriptional regulator [Thermohalobacter berrensis]|uniref:GntR family transcriptional regulator n=1 Tax=Thermohalobacter berrensis TaxID=99594 RepID=A0A419T0G5_9FIRM|nr:GntR family transcriptional regulator [Thermohalobacter berrensis]
MDKLKVQNYKPLRDIVFESLREAIIDGRLEPGERLMEVQLAEKLGVSRTPIREAIRKLELEGLVIMIPRKGAYVSDVSFKDILDVLEIRASLEGLAAALASERITEEEMKILKDKVEEFDKCIEENNVECMVKIDSELHSAIFTATRNEKLISIAESLKEQVQRFRRIYIREYHNSEQLSHEHKRIINAIEKGDVNKASKYAKEHIANAHRNIVEAFKDKIDK